MTLRERVIQLAQKVSYESELPVEQVWAISYKRLNSKRFTAINTISSAMNAKSKLDVVESLDLLEDLYQILLENLTAR